ncbi:phage shock envelope stress response protein PspM [Allokutzneria albata]|uniref:Uncharacterized protein n=1 Tax=Allokutzneria albata TaxID=211114 RepID=A0A1G9X4T4_ALLAB|nr:hypothetical protein [Allokutzneria albata]SDM91718.1 hypothetical protein SAMN04489726_3988 [Allokutzneria albata]
MASGRDELTKLGELVVKQLRNSGELTKHLRGAADAVDGVQRKLSAWRDPRAKMIRQRKRSVRRIWFRTTLAAAAGVVAFFVGNDPGIELSEAALGTVSVLSAAAATSAGVRSYKLHKTPLPEPAAPPPPLPPSSSAARGPMRELAEAEALLADLLTQLATPRNGVPPVPLESVGESRAIAAEAAAAIREVAAQLRAVEQARDVAPAEERPGLDAAVARLLHELVEGVEGYRGLVAAAGKAVAASTTMRPMHALDDATDRLAGLAAALRELASGNGRF